MFQQVIIVYRKSGGYYTRKNIFAGFTKNPCNQKFFFGEGWYVIMIASCGRGVEGVVPDDYNITQGRGGLSGPPIVITNFICQNMLDMVLQKW